MTGVATASVSDVQTALAAVQAQIAAIQAAVAAGPSGAGDAFAAALDSATSTDSGTATASATGGTAATTTTATASTATASAGALATNGTTGQDVANDALKYVGVPYVYGGESTSGMDCSGLVQKVFSDLGVSVPRQVHEQQTIGTAVDSLKDAKPGDLIVLNGGDHIAVYLGNDTVIHAPYAGRTVSVQKVWFGDKDITAIRRVVPSDTTTSGTSASDLSTAAQLLALQGASGSSSTDSSSTDSSSSLSSLLSGLGSGSSSTAQQLLAARASLLSAGAA